MKTTITKDTSSIKEELKQKIDLENDPVVLKAIQDLLFPEENDPIYIEKLLSRSLKADEDIKAGRVYDEEEFFKRSKDFFSKR
jgi:hypothetical protein